MNAQPKPQPADTTPHNEAAATHDNVGIAAAGEPYLPSRVLDPIQQEIRFSHQPAHLQGLEASLRLVSRLSQELAKQPPQPYRRMAETVGDASTSLPASASGPFNHDFFNHALAQTPAAEAYLRDRTRSAWLATTVQARSYPRLTLALAAAIALALVGGAALWVQPHYTDNNTNGRVISATAPLVVPANPVADTANSPSGENDNFDITLPGSGSAADKTQGVPEAAETTDADTTHDMAKDATPMRPAHEDPNADGADDDASDTDASTNPSAIAPMSPLPAAKDLSVPMTVLLPDIAPRAARNTVTAHVAEPPVPQALTVPQAPATNNNADIATLRAYYRKNTSDVDALTALANALSLESAPTHLAELQSLAIEHPQSASVQAALGRVLAQQGDMTQATMRINRAVDIDRSNPHYLFDLAAVYDHAGNAKQALSLYRQVLRMAARLAPEAQTALPLGDVQIRAQFLASQIGE